MSSTRKPKPPDKGAPPEHKPSRKVALEEVLRSLQDLVSNELATEPTKPSSEADTPATIAKKSGPVEKPAVTRSAYSADVLPSVLPVAAEPAAEPEPVTLDHDLLAPPDSTVPDGGDELPDLGAEPLTPQAESAATAGNTIPVEGLQQELPYLDVVSPAPSVNPRAPTPEAAEFQMAEIALEDLPQLEPAHTEVNTDSIADSSTLPDLAPMSTVEALPAPAPAEATNWDDLPVLDEAVELAEEIETDAPAHGTGTPKTATLPPANAAHRLAIQVAARLNVELRKSGQQGLNSDIITRLARLLQEALAKGSANMENSPPDKH